MKKVLIFGGTTEGRVIAETLSKNGISIHVCVATEYGRQVLKEKKNLHILEGRLDFEAMKKLCHENHYDFIIDATHPFATVVSRNVMECAKTENIPMIRFERDVNMDGKRNLFYADTPEECKKILLQTPGKILLTTGSKDLNIFCSDPSLRKRITARVLPGMESLKLCYDNGLEGKQIIAMQGPFSKKMNMVQIEDSGISILVTKESGKTGGTDLKIEAALEEGIKCIVIKNPLAQKKDFSDTDNYFSCTSLHEVYSLLGKKLSVYVAAANNGEHAGTNKINVHLIGIGMGNAKTMTMEAVEKMENAQIIFGAPRILEGINSKTKKIPYYLSKDIIPILKKSMESEKPAENVCILFSGDTGFFSGASKLQDDLHSLKNVSVNIIPGISSMSYLASKTGLSYQDAEVISLHGTEKKIWLPKLNESLSKEKKIFILTSGIKDVHEIGKLVYDYNESAGKKYKVASGFQLSYENERVEIMEPQDCLSLNDNGLYSIFLFME